MDFNVALSNPARGVERGDDSLAAAAAATSASDAGLRVEHYATDQPTPTGEPDDLEGGWYFYKA